MNRKLFVGNLSFNTEESTLEALFAQAGPVTSVRVMRDQATGRARGFAFVEMETDEGARAAIEKFNNAEVEGRRLAVNEARPQTPGGSRFGGPGGGGRPGGGGGRGGGGFGGGRGGGGGRREPRW
jgi:RNA recognition motif-containing protein